jgi:hypothetical protein
VTDSTPEARNGAAHFARLVGVAFLFAAVYTLGSIAPLVVMLPLVVIMALVIMARAFILDAREARA